MKHLLRLKSMLSNALVVSLIIQSLSLSVMAKTYDKYPLSAEDLAEIQKTRPLRPSDLVLRSDDKDIMMYRWLTSGDVNAEEGWSGTTVQSYPEGIGDYDRPWKKMFDESLEKNVGNEKVVESLSQKMVPNWQQMIAESEERFKNGDPGSTSTPETNKVSASNNSDGKSNQKDDAGKASIANQILAIGTGIIGSNILIDCKLGALTPSMYTFMAGSLVYIGSEITGAKAQQAFIKVKKEEVEQLKKTMTEGGDLQKGIIEVKLKEEEDKLEFVKKRKKWTMAVAAMYGAATGLAAMEQACVSNPASLPFCTQWVMAGCTGGTSLPANTALSAAVLGAYGFAVGNAGGTAVSRYGTAVASAMAVLVPSLTGAVAIAYQTPMSRIVTFGAGTALTAAVMMELNKVQKDLEKNISDLKRLSADFNSKTDGSSGGLDESAGDAGSIKDGNHNISSGAGNIAKMGSGTSIEKSCWGTDASGNQTYSASACNKTLQLTKPKYNSKFSLPTLQKVANTGVDMAQAVARGDMAKADVAAADLAANAMKVKEITDNLVKQLNDQNKKLGKDPINLDAEVQKSLAGMNNNLNKGLASRGIDLASLGSDKASLDKSTALLGDGSETTKGSAATLLDPNKNAIGLEFNEGSSDEAFDPNSGLVKESSEATHTIDDFETAEADILDRPDTSIFKQLSNRYLLNYPKIFNNEAKSPEKEVVKQTK